MYNPGLKLFLYNKCLEYAEQRILNVQTAINSATESGNDEVKSSAGDKHETGRAMAQLEQEKSAWQLQEALELKNTLSRIDPGKNTVSVANGSVVLTNQGNFYISISAGKIEIDEAIYFAVSVKSPLAMAFIGAIVSSEIKFNGLCYRIETIL